jgi:hypothetical protein
MQMFDAARAAIGAQGDPNAELAQKKQNIDEFKGIHVTGTPERPATGVGTVKDKVNPKARYGSRPGEERIDTSGMTKPLGSFEKGTSHVPKTGIYKLHEGEAVIPKEKNMDSMKDKMMDALGGDKAPKKEIKEMVHRKTTNGKHIVVHKHHHPAHHPDEEHAMENMAEVHKHMEDHAGTPNEGEAAPADGSAPTQLTAAPSPMPAPVAGATPAGM